MTASIRRCFVWVGSVRYGGFHLTGRFTSSSNWVLHTTYEIDDGSLGLPVTQSFWALLPAGDWADWNNEELFVFDEEG